jgi:hypothetical protein
MATRKRQIKKSNRKTKSLKSSKSQKPKYFMNGCAIKNKSLAAKIKHRKTCPKCRMMRGGCGTCNMGGGGNKRGGGNSGSLGFYDSLSNITTDAFGVVFNAANSMIHASPPAPSAFPTNNQFSNKYN